MIDIEVFSKLLEKYTWAFDHDMFATPEEDVAVLAIYKDEYTSNSGAHSVGTLNWVPDFIDRDSDYYIAKPVALIDLSWGEYRVTKFSWWDELPAWLRQFLDRLNGMDAGLGDYTLDFLYYAIKRIGLSAIVWEVTRGIDAILIADVPRTERETAEWFADWIERRIVEYMAEEFD